MSASDNHKVGGGSTLPIDFTTNGTLRERIDPLEPVHTTVVVGTEPTTGRRESGITYFRTNGAKVQFCVRFPSGAVQVLATEPD